MRSSTPRLAAHWPRVAERLRASRRVAFFLDFDGTLAPSVRLPEYARLPAATRHALRRLARHPRATVVVISGRRRADLRRRVAIPGVRYLGLYGREDSRPVRLSRLARGALKAIGLRLARGLPRTPHVWIENKDVSLSVHLRDAPACVAVQARREIHRALRPFRSTLREFENLRDVEIVPRTVAGKGAAVRRVLAQPLLRHALAVYFGDDLSDEPGFAAVGRGVAVLVSSGRPTRAHYTIGRPAHVAGWLSQMEAALND
jgi:trehalose 6-phosphate phosphatase